MPKDYKDLGPSYVNTLEPLYWKNPAKGLEYKLLEDSLNELESFSPADKLLQDLPEPYFAMPEVARPAGLIEFVERWHDPEFRKSYLNLKEDIGEEYMVGPASYAGYIEESPALYNDIASAAKETGVDPEFLYNVAMQEGLSKKMNIRHQWNVNPERGSQDKELLYSSDELLDSFSDIGLDTIFEDQDLALGRGYLKERIVPAEKIWHEVSDDEFKGVEYVKVKNEAGLMVDRAKITSKDALRGVGAIIRLNKDYLKSSFEEEGIDFDALPEKQQNFWLYAAFNAGAGNTEKLLKTYGVDPYSNPKFVEKLKIQQEIMKSKKNMTWEELAKIPLKEYDALPDTPLAEWMKNVGRVVGGTEITDLYKPWDDDLVYGDLKE